LISAREAKESSRGRVELIKRGGKHIKHRNPDTRAIPTPTMFSSTCARMPTQVKPISTSCTEGGVGRHVVLMSEGAIAWPTTFGESRVDAAGVNEGWTTMPNRSSLIHPNDQTTRQSAAIVTHKVFLFYREFSWFPTSNTKCS